MTTNNNNTPDEDDLDYIDFDDDYDDIAIIYVEALGGVEKILF
jgi:hypothetical protein